MTHLKSLLAALSALALATWTQSPALAVGGAPQGDTITIELTSGKVVVKLRPDLAPKHVERIKTLVGKGFYNGLKFHRVIDGFMAQTGDPTGTGMSGSDLPDLKAEFSPTPYKRGTVGAARTADPNTANSQFFICFNDKGCSGLTGQYTVWGEVISGMEWVDRIKRGAPGSGEVEEPDIMVKVTAP
ncbi:MAG: peptidylprolyl isomerase [Hyphomicrobium sp.]